MTLVVAMLMVSNIQYAHLVNHWIRGRRPISYVLKLVIIVLAMLYEFAIVAAAFATVYALSGPALTAWRRFRPGRDAQDRADDVPEGDADP